MHAFNVFIVVFIVLSEIYRYLSRKSVTYLYILGRSHKLSIPEKILYIASLAFCSSTLAPHLTWALSGLDLMCSCVLLRV